MSLTVSSRNYNPQNNSAKNIAFGAIPGNCEGLNNVIRRSSGGEKLLEYLTAREKDIAAIKSSGRNFIFDIQQSPEKGSLLNIVARNQEFPHIASEPVPFLMSHIPHRPAENIVGQLINKIEEAGKKLPAVNYDLEQKIGAVWTRIAELGDKA